MRPARIGANQGDIGDVNGRFLLRDPALGALPCLARNCLLHYPHVFDEDTVPCRGKRAARARSCPGRYPEHLDRIVATNIQTRHDLLISSVSSRFELPKQPLALTTRSSKTSSRAIRGPRARTRACLPARVHRRSPRPHSRRSGCRCRRGGDAPCGYAR